MTKANKRWVLLLVFAILIGLFGFAILHRGLKNNQSHDQLILYGNVDIRQVDLAFNGAERIANMLVEEGQIVKKGQLVATLDTTAFGLTVEKARALVRTQTQIVARLEAGSRPEEIRKAAADVNAAEAEAANAELNYDRTEKLAQADATTRQAADNARAAAEIARARLKAVKEALNLAVAGPRKEDIEAARATLDAYKAELSLAEKQLADANLYAPTNGIIQNRLLEPGEMASPQKPVFMIAVTDPKWVRAYLSEPDLNKVHSGMTASVAVDAFRGRRFDGWVGFISPVAEFTPKAVQTEELRTSLVYEVRVFVKDPSDELRLGTPATVYIPLHQSGRPSPATSQATIPTTTQAAEDR
jgi:HlyD family secretion protein